MNGYDWEALQKWQQEKPGRRVLVELDSRVPMFPPYNRILTESIIVSSSDGNYVSMAINPDEIYNIDNLLLAKAVKQAHDAIRASEKTLAKLAANG